jgi:hypothetical protein
MSPLQKPEWIEIANADKAASVRRVSKGLPVMALVAVAAILGVGVVAAQTQEQTPANAVESVVPSVQTTQVAATSDPAPMAAANSAPIRTTDVSFVTSASKESVAPTAATPKLPSVKNPSIGTMPTGGGDDEGDDDEGDDDEGDDD